jgi:hypothetical protein
MKRLLLLIAVLLAVPYSAEAAYESLGRQEDSASADGHVLVPMGCVRQDAIAGSTSTDADYGNVKCNSVGRVYTSATVDAPLPAGTNAIGKLSANTGVIIGDVNLVSAIPAGANAIGSVSISSITPGTGATNLGKAEDAAHVSGDTGVQSLCVLKATSTAGLGADGDYAPCGMTAAGEIYTFSNTELAAPAALADNTANPTITGVAAYMMCFDGTNWDRCLPGLSDTDDNSVAFSQVTSLVIGATHVSDGASWVRLRTYVEDAASVGGEQLSLSGTVRQDTPAGSTSLDGDYSYLKSDSVGRLWVNCGSGCAGTQYTEDVASAGAESLTLAGTIRQDAPAGTTSLDGDYQNLKTDSVGRLWVNCGTGCSGGTQFAEDAVHTTGDVGTIALARRADAASSSSGTDGDYSMLNVDAAGRLWVNCGVGCAGGASTPADAFANPTTAGLQMEFLMGWNGATWDRLRSSTANGLVADVSRIVAALPSGGNTIGTVNMGTFAGTGVEDAAETAGGTLLMQGTVRRDVAASSANASGDNTTANTDALGLLWTRTLDPCSGVAKVSVPINISTATTTELVAASASNFVYVCSLNIGPTAGAQNIALIEDDTAACASPTAGVAGGTTASSGWNIAANGGLTFGSGVGMIAKTSAANRYLCLISSAAVQTSGVLTYALAP